MSKRILWYQPEKLNDDDVIIFNGKRLEGNDYSSSFDEIKRISDAALGHHTPWGGKVKGYYFAKGLLNTKDEKGRWLGFMFLTDEKKGVEALKHELNTLGFQMTPKTENTLKSNEIARKFVPVIIIIAIITLITLIILNYENK